MNPTHEPPDNNPLWNLVHTIEYFLPDQDTNRLMPPSLTPVYHADGSIHVQIHQKTRGHRIVFRVGNHLFQEIVKPSTNGTNGDHSHGMVITGSPLAAIDNRMDIPIANGIRYTFCAHVHKTDDAGLARACMARTRARLLNQDEEDVQHSALFRHFPRNQDPSKLGEETLIVVETRPRIMVTTLHVRPDEQTILVTVSSVIIAKS